MSAQKRIGAVSRFVSRVTSLCDAWSKEDGEPVNPWFRGHTDADWHLVPKLYGYQDRDEDEIRSEFRRRASQLTGPESLPEGNDHWAWYFLMQHHGAPTRLLDWTDGALLALHFALWANKGDRDAAVWVLDPCWLNERAIDRAAVLLTNYPKGVADRWLRPPYSRTKPTERWPVAIDPPHVSRRVAVQHSRFTIHGTDREGLGRLAERRKSRVVKLTIAGRNVQDMKNDLSTLGIVETTVFPDLDGLCRELEADYCSEPIERK